MYEKHVTVEELYEREKDLKREDVLVLQNWASKQSHLPEISELNLISFLHSCYYKMEAAKVCLDNFYTLRAHWPEFSQNRDVFSKENQLTLHMLLGTCLPMRDKNGAVVVYTRLLDTNIGNYDPMVQIRIFDMIVWMWYLYMGTSPGQVLVMDMHGASLAHLMKCNLVHMKKHMYYIQEALPVRLKAIHLINVSSITDKLLTMLKPFMKRDLMNLMHTHSKIDTLFDYVPKEAMPKEFGGKAGSFRELHERQIRMMEENAQVFLDSEKMIADETKRQGKAKNANDVFGIEGSFRKLDID